MTTAARPDQPVLVMTRVIDAPRAAVFAQWMQPEHLARWWSGGGVVRAASAAEVAPGDAFRFRTTGARGAAHWVKVVYREIARPERLVFTWGGDRAETETVVTVEFAEQGGATRISLRQVVARTRAARERIEQRLSERLDRLASLIEDLAAPP